MTPIRVLIFTNSFLVGGSERQAVELARSLDRTKFDVMLACFQKNGHLLGELTSDVSCPDVYPLKGFLSASCVHQSMRFLRFLRGIRPHVVQCFDFYSNIFAIPIARLSGVPVILGARRNEGVKNTRAQKRAERWCFGLATGVVANAEALKEQLVIRDGVRPDRVWVIHNGLDMSRFDQADIPSNGAPVHDKHEITIGVVGNLRPEKGHLLFLTAAQRVAKEYPGATFVLVGDGPMRAEIETKMGELGLRNRVRIFGTLNAIPEFLRSVDIVVNPSVTEGLPNAVMESMAASKPVVATHAGGTHELVVDGYTGYLVKVGDVATLAERIRTLCNDPVARLRMGEAGRKRIIERFTADRMARSFEELYLELLTRRKTGKIVTGVNLASPRISLLKKIQKFLPIAL